MKFIKTLFLIFLFSTLILPQEQRYVLVELFTNSHCPLCPPAHSTLDSYNQNSPNADKINYIFYHMVYPYSDDPLYQYNKSDSDGRNVYYNPSSSTPIAFFDGVKQTGSYSSWASVLNGQVAEESPFKITLTGSLADSIMHINAEVFQSGNVTATDLVINIVLVENVYYTGRNGIPYHRNVMRKMVTSPTGEPFSITMGDTKNVVKDITIGEGIIPENTSVVVFIQSSAGKTVYQSSHITYSELSSVTGVEPVNETPSKYSLVQNYPNPFNPSTKIKYYLPEEAFVNLKVYNILGKEISSLVNKGQLAGSYEYTFNAGDLSSGIYFYRLTAVNHAGKETVQTKKMTLLK
jgi:Outer membrane protein Omp28/Secretion system C-terminal sorting domain